MKELYLGISIVLGIILLTMWGEGLASILSFAIFGIVGLLFMSTLVNYQDSKAILRKIKRRNSYE